MFISPDHYFQSLRHWVLVPRYVYKVSQDYDITIIVIIIERLIIIFTYFLYTSLVNIDIFCQGVEVMEITSNIILYKILYSFSALSTVFISFINRAQYISIIQTVFVCFFMIKKKYKLTYKINFVLYPSIEDAI